MNYQGKTSGTMTDNLFLRQQSEHRIVFDIQGLK